MNPLELLWEAEGLPAFDLPTELAALYPGSIGFDDPRLFANFVETIDGVVAIPSIAQSNKLIAAGSAVDRFVMGLLRACADAVVIGSGTLTASPRGVWTPEQAYPDAAPAYDELRSTLGLSAAPEVVVISGSGMVDTAHPVFEAGALLLTADTGQALLATGLPGATTVISLGPGSVIDPVAAVGVLRARGHRRILHEGGPHLIGSFLEAGAVDELFLTVSPLLTGRSPLDPRIALVEGADLLPDGVATRLLGVRRGGDHLFLRYEILPR
jgi:riboflavin biosynthesis pyrimidine reductase